MELLVHPIAPLITFAIANAAALSAMVWLRVQAPAAAEMVLSFVWYLMLIMWMETDSRVRRSRPCFDFGLIAMFLFPMSVVWYCFWSRGWRGALVLSLLLGLWLGPYFVAAFVAVVRFVVP